MATFVDAERAVADWINGQTSTLVGSGNPLPMGAHLNEQRGGANTCYALLSLLPGGVAFGAENPDHRARISASVYGPTKAVATKAAVALADAYLTLSGAAVAIAGATGATCLVVDPDSISGPLWSPDSAGPRLILDADFYLRAA